MTARKQGNPPQPAPDVPVVLNEAEKALVARSIERRRGQPPRAALKTSGPNQMAPDHRDPHVGWAIMEEAFGTSDPKLVGQFLDQLSNAFSSGADVDLDAVNGAIALVQAVKPRDPLEAMLASQMAAIHAATMTFTRRLKRVETIPQQESAVNALSKLARTYAAQMECLKRYRSAGDQTVRVEHVHVHAGGQAVVGNVTGGRGATQKGEATP